MRQLKTEQLGYVNCIYCVWIFAFIYLKKRKLLNCVNGCMYEIGCMYIQMYV